ncbi:immunity protein [Niallia circulans]|uniref:immunity protein n=1 Tax=Niallia circulans TaxID=1397 RepID=UPI0026EABA2F|nr:immunity protein [Niallia circulans]
MSSKQRNSIWIIYGIISCSFLFIDTWEPFGVMLLILGGILLAFRPSRNRNRKLAEENMNKNRILTEYDKEFNADHSYSTIDEKIAVNEELQMFKIYKFDKEKQIVESKIKFDQIMDSEIKMDNDTIFKASRSNQIGGAIIGGMVAGGVGAIIGGSSPTTSKIEKVKAIQLKIRIDDFKNPNLTFDFLPTPKQMGVNTFEGFDKNGIEYKTAYERAEFWHSLLEIAIRKTNNKVSV